MTNPINKVFIIFLFSQIVFADDGLKRDQVPEKILAAFKEAYPKAHHIEYEIETENGKKLYEIDFKEGRRKVQAHYREDGSLLRVDTHKSDDDD